MHLDQANIASQASHAPPSLAYCQLHLYLDVQAVHKNLVDAKGGGEYRSDMSLPLELLGLNNVVLLQVLSLIRSCLLT